MLAINAKNDRKERFSSASLAIIALLLVAAIGSPSNAQSEPDDGLRTRHLPVMSAARPPNSRTIEAELGNLIDATERVGKQISSSNAIPPKTETGIRAILNDQPTDQHKPVKSVSEIRERIQLLKRLRERNETLSNTAEPANSNQRFRPVTPDRTSAASTAQPTLSAIESNLTEKTPPKQNAMPSIAPKIKARKILSSPVSHLELGQSLYQTKNYNAALKALQKVETRRLTDSDRAWLELLLALCQRKLGNLDSAEAGLRELANAKSADYPVSVARWWLKQTESVRNSKVTANTNLADTDALIERSRQYVEHQ